MTEREFTAQNMLFVAFPVALILVAEMQFANAIGAMGFTCIFETFCILGITAYEKYVRMHSPFCMLAGIAHTLNCFNFSIWCGLVAGAPLITIGVFAIAHRLIYHPNEDMWHPNTMTAVLSWLLDTWFIFGRAAILFAQEPTNHVDHYWFDTISAIILTIILIGVGGAVRYRK